VLADKEPHVSPSFRSDDLDVSPEVWTSCSQKELEPILLQAACTYRQAQLLFGTQLVSFEEMPGGITAQIGDRASGRLREVRCRYLIAADGSKSAVRERLGLSMLGPGVLTHNISIHFRARLGRYLPSGPNFLHFVQNEHVMGMFVATDGESRWVFAVPYHPELGESPDTFTQDRAVDLVRKGAGVPDLHVEVVGVVPWRMEADRAERMRLGNVFLAGDAAHRMTPAGGLGLNTAVQDVHNLCWKVAAVLQGWAGPGLLDTYEVERRPVAQQNVDRSVALITGADNVGGRSALDFDLGATYESRAVFSDGNEPGARPGSRAPHAWISSGGDRLSTLDLFGPRFTLLAGRGGDGWCDAAREMVCDLEVNVPDQGAAWRSLYGIEESGAVLIRPDGHVAWRRATAVASPRVALDKVLNSVLSRGDQPNVKTLKSRRVTAGSHILGTGRNQEVTRGDVRCDV
jgi:putative polyketide hydroxylase